MTFTVWKSNLKWYDITLKRRFLLVDFVERPVLGVNIRSTASTDSVGVRISVYYYFLYRKIKSKFTSTDSMSKLCAKYCTPKETTLNRFPRKNTSRLSTKNNFALLKYQLLHQKKVRKSILADSVHIEWVNKQVPQIRRSSVDNVTTSFSAQTVKKPTLNPFEEHWSFILLLIVQIVQKNKKIWSPQTLQVQVHWTFEGMYNFQKFELKM